MVHQVAQLTQTLVDISSVSGDEARIATWVEGYLEHLGFDVLRDGDTLVVATHYGRPQRVVLAGHLDTVPVADNLPSRIAGSTLIGRGSVDMKAGCAVFLALLSHAAEFQVDVTAVFYDHEEVAAELSGLGRTIRNHPEWISGDVAVLGEPTNGAIEGGCNGTLRFELTAHGKAAHSARPWMGVNAIEALIPALEAMAAFGPSERKVGGLRFHESLLPVAIEGGRPANSVPDLARVTGNFRFAPDRSGEEAQAFLQHLFADVTRGGVPLDFRVTDCAPGAQPAMDHPLFSRLEAQLAQAGFPSASAKLGWTDVARFSAMGIPAINCGPGDPLLAHRSDEAVDLRQVEALYEAMKAWLIGMPEERLHQKRP